MLGPDLEDPVDLDLLFLGRVEHAGQELTVDEVVALDTLARRPLSVALEELGENEAHIVCEGQGMMDEVEGHMASEAKGRITEDNVFFAEIGRGPAQVVGTDNAGSSWFNVEADGAGR